jgi:hypothetical protein
MTIILNGTTGVTFPNGVTMSDGTSAPVTVAQGGTGANTASGARTALGVAIGTDVLAPNGSGANLTSLNASSVSSGTLASARLPTSGVNAASITTGTLAVAQGGTGTASPSLVGGTNITISGSWPNQTVTAAGGGVTSLNGQTGAITNTTLGNIGSYILGINNNSSVSYGTTYPASQVQVVYLSAQNTCTPSPVNIQTSASGVVSGTWRAMNSAQGNYGLILYVRVS